MAHIWRTLSFFVYLLPAVHVQADRCLIAIIGETVQIPCCLNTKQSLKTENISVEWTTSNNHMVHSFVEGKDNLSRQDPQFKGRTQLFRSGLSCGNFSLRLSNVSQDDEQTYKCSYSATGEPKNTSLVVLQVTAVKRPAATIGDTVQIPCSLKTDVALKTENILVEWTTSEGLNVHSFVNGMDNLTHQGSRFKGRTQLIIYELSRGNFSLSLSNVSSNDEQTYKCSYSAGEDIKHLSVQCLQVAERRNTVELFLTSPMKTLSSSFQIHLTDRGMTAEQSAEDSGLGGVGLAVLMAVIVVVVFIVLMIPIVRIWRRQTVPREDNDIEVPLQQSPTVCER